MINRAPASGPPLVVDEDYSALVTEACDALAAPQDWTIDASEGVGSTAIVVHHDLVELPPQGWKLHVTSDVASSALVLSRVLPVLLEGNATFKVIRTPAALARLNGGLHGLSQIGKFITVYPVDDRQAVDLATALDVATRSPDLHGPAIPSDRPLRPGSLVHYRYGGFRDQFLHRPSGNRVPAIRAPDGRLVPDLRMLRYHRPAWAVDPFESAGISCSQSPRTPLLGGRYLVVATIHQAPERAVHLAIDIRQPRCCIVKQARGGCGEGRGGEPRERLRAEAALHHALSDDASFPTLYDLFDDQGDLFMVVADVEGTPLDRYLLELRVAGRHVPASQLIAWGREVALALDTMHARGILHRDPTLANLIVTPDGHLRLVDLSLSHPIREPTVAVGSGTRGYIAPGGDVGRAPDVSDDVYGFGALMFGLASGADPAAAPHPSALLARPLPLLNPAVSPGVVAVVSRCLAVEAGARYPSMRAIADALAAGEQEPARNWPAYGDGDQPEPDDAARRGWRELARRLGDTLCRALVTNRPSSGRAELGEVYSGGGGILLALADLVATLGDPVHRAALAASARELAAAPGSLEGDRAWPTGLYVGEAGICTALLRAGQVLADDALVVAALTRAGVLAAQPHSSPDPLSGTPGRLRLHVWLHDETGETEQLTHAVDAGEWLLAAAEAAEEGGLRWRTPEGYDELTGQYCLGYAHGVAGIADALLELYDATGHERFLVAAQQSGRWLLRQAVPVLDAGDGLGWPRWAGTQLNAPFWCHGATGIGQFFLHAAAVGALNDAGVAERAARAAARGARWAGPTQCHGLAGNIEFLLDVFHATGNRAHLGEAWSLARLLSAFAVEVDHQLSYVTGSAGEQSPAYMTGYAGIAACLLRLGAADAAPRGLSRAGFRRRGAAELTGAGARFTTDEEVARGSDAHP
jgi:Lanthionine synthetase C-like protein/Protein kinase domain